MAKKIPQQTNSQTSTQRVVPKRSTTKQNPSEIKKTLSKDKGTPSKKQTSEKYAKKSAPILEVREKVQTPTRNSQKSARLSQKARQNSTSPQKNQQQSASKTNKGKATLSKDLAKKTASVQKNTLLSFVSKTSSPAKNQPSNSSLVKKSEVATTSKSPEKKPERAAAVKANKIEEVKKEVPQKSSIEQKVEKAPSKAHDDKNQKTQQKSLETAKSADKDNKDLSKKVETKTKEKVEKQVIIPQEVQVWKDKVQRFSEDLDDLVKKAIIERDSWNKFCQEQTASETSSESTSAAQIKLLLNSVEKGNKSADEINLLMVSVLATKIEFSDLNLEELSAHLKQSATAIFESNLKESSSLQALLSSFDFTKMVMGSANRELCGAPPKTYDLYTDITPQACWFWRLASPQIHLQSAPVRNQSQNLTKSLQSSGQLAKALSQLISAINKAKKVADVTNISTQHAKYMKILQKRNEQMSILKAKQLKEQMKAQEEDQKRKLIQEEKDKKERERLEKEQEKIRQKQEKEQAQLREKQEREEKKEAERLAKEAKLEQERKEKEEALKLKEKERLEREEAKEKERQQKELERQQKEKAREVERLEREAAKEREKVEKEQKRKALELERLEKKRAQEEAAKQAQLLREQQKQERLERIEREKREAAELQEKLAAEKAAKEAASKLTKFFTNPAPKPTSTSKTGLSTGNGSKLGANSTSNTSGDSQENPAWLRAYDYVSEAKKTQVAFQCRFDKDLLESRPVYTKDLLIQTMRTFSDWHKQLDSQKQERKKSAGIKPVRSSNSLLIDTIGQQQKMTDGRKNSSQQFESRFAKCIIIEDSRLQIFGRYKKTSKVLTARNPFAKDDDLIDYDMDSEDEEAEANGEDLQEKGGAEEDEDEEMANEEAEQEGEGFIVSDGHLSVCEYDFSQKSSQNSQDIRQNIHQRRQALKEKIYEKKLIEGKPYLYTIDKDATSSALTDLTIVGLSSSLHSLPLSCIKPEKVIDFSILGSGDPNAILKKRLDLIQFVYTSLESKQQIIDDFNEKFPECSKKSIERVFKEIIVKEKREGDLRPAWYATDDILVELAEDLEKVGGQAMLKQLAVDRMQPLAQELAEIEAQKAEETRLREELKRLEAEQREEERLLKERERQLEREKQQLIREKLRHEKEAQKEMERRNREAEKIKEREEREAAKLAEAEAKAQEKELKRIQKEEETALKLKEAEEARLAKQAAKEEALRVAEEERIAKLKAKEEEKAQKIAEKERERIAKEKEKADKLAEKEAEKKAKDAEREAEKKAKIAEREAEKKAKEAEKEAARLEKEKAKQAKIAEKAAKGTLKLQEAFNKAAEKRKAQQSAAQMLAESKAAKIAKGRKSASKAESKRESKAESKKTTAAQKAKNVPKVEKPPSQKQSPAKSQKSVTPLNPEKQQSSPKKEVQILTTPSLKDTDAAKAKSTTQPSTGQKDTPKVIETLQKTPSKCSLNDEQPHKSPQTSASKKANISDSARKQQSLATYLTK